MTETVAPAFVPSPGIPNEAHARFYENVKRFNAPVAPPTSGPQQFQTEATRQHIAMKAAEYAKTATAAQPAAPASSKPTVDSIKAYEDAKRNPKPAAQPYLDGTENNVKAFDAEMRAAGKQTGTDTVAAKDRLIAEYRATPAAERAKPAWKAQWEAKYAAADAAGETPAAEAKPANSSQGTTATPTPAVNTAVDFVIKNSNAEGMMVSHSIPKELLSGYTLPGSAKVHAETAIRMLADARRDGIPQSVVDAYVRSLK